MMSLLLQNDWSQLQSIDLADETIGEIAFEMYWTYWPTNFGTILQALVFGPLSVSISNEVPFEFL